VIFGTGVFYIIPLFGVKYLKPQYTNQVQYFSNDFHCLFLYCSEDKMPARKDKKWKMVTKIVSLFKK